MGRPPLPLGTHGKILFIDMPNGTVQARVNFRDYDGRVRRVTKFRGSRAAAERALKADLVNRQTPGGAGSVRSGSRLTELADAWLEAEHGWSAGTARTYSSVVRSQVKPALGQLRVREVTPGIVSRTLTAIARSAGPAAAKSTRACLSGMFAYAIEDSAIAVNPVRDARARLASSRRAPRALTRRETDRLVALFHNSQRAADLDLPDIVDWMLATGCRIGEALAARYGTGSDGSPILDLDAGTWEVNATVVRVPGEGLTIQPRPKSKAGWRVVALPAFAVRMLRCRRDEHVNATDLVFAAPLARSLRDPTNVSGDLRQLLDSFECAACSGTGYRLNMDRSAREGSAGRRVRCVEGPWSWVTSHTFRKTVATRLDEAGLTPRQVADQLGHANPSMTLDVYFGRHVVSAAAADVLNR